MLSANVAVISRHYAKWDLGKTYSGVSFSGGLNLTATTSAGGGASATDISCGSIKSYCEITIVDVGNVLHLGLWGNDSNIGSGGGYLGPHAHDYSYDSTGAKTSIDGSFAYGSGFTNGDVIGVKWDMVNSTIGFLKNNVDQGTMYTSIPSGLFLAFSSDPTGTSVAVTLNVGQTAFNYTPPAGYQSGLYQ